MQLDVSQPYWWLHGIIEVARQCSPCFPLVSAAPLSAFCFRRGFTKFTREDYVQWKRAGRFAEDGVNAKVVCLHHCLPCGAEVSLNRQQQFLERCRTSSAASELSFCFCSCWSLLHLHALPACANELASSAVTHVVHVLPVTPSFCVCATVAGQPRLSGQAGPA